MELVPPVRVRSYFFERDGGPHIRLQVDADVGTIRFYYCYGLEELLRAEKEAGRLNKPTLTPAEAVKKAKAHVTRLRGRLPDDLVVDYVYVPSGDNEGVEDDGFGAPPDFEVSPLSNDRARGDVMAETFWEVRFTRYAGAIPYDWQGVLVRFSEHYGVVSHTDYCFDEWKGEVEVGAEEAVRIAGEKLDEYLLTEIWDADSEDVDPPMLELPLRVEGGRPFLMNVVEAEPRAVHAIWKVALPYAVLWKETRPGIISWQKLVAYVDAETGDVIRIGDEE